VCPCDIVFALLLVESPGRFSFRFLLPLTDISHRGFWPSRPRIRFYSRYFSVGGFFRFSARLIWITVSARVVLGFRCSISASAIDFVVNVGASRLWASLPVRPTRPLCAHRIPFSAVKAKALLWFSWSFSPHMTALLLLGLRVA
jgi:hypothetical protein